MKKVFTSNKSYFNFINKNRDKINILNLRLLGNKITIIYEVLV